MPHPRLHLRSFAAITVTAIAALPAAAAAQETRALSAHAHGLTVIELAVEDGAVVVNLDAPGADVVGFEYAPETDADRAAVDAALGRLADPAAVLALPDAAGCVLEDVSVELVRAEAGDHAGHDDHEDHAGDHGQDKDEAGGAHSAFEAAYAFDCADAGVVTAVIFPYFETFEAAREIELRYVTDRGAGSATVRRDRPEADLD